MKPEITRPFFVAIEGPIGAGKTTLATWLSHEWQTELTLERFANNPFLPLFYTDRQQYALQTQLYFLLDRFDQWSELSGAVPTAILPAHFAATRPGAEPKTKRDHPALVSDYLFDKDRVFAELTLSSEELRRYLKVFEALRSGLVQPTHVIYLSADVPTLLSHIHKRGRSYETAISAAYLADLNRAYDTFFAEYKHSPVLRLDTNTLDGLSEVTSDKPSVLGPTVQALLNRLGLFITTGG